MRFSKYHGTRNDFVMIGDPDGALDVTRDLIRAICDRRGGVGADGLIRIVRGEVAVAAGLTDLPGASDADFFMDHYNADGSEAEMCGNGIRCLAKFAYDRGLTASARLSVMTRAGLKRLDLEVGEGVVERVTVDMGVPVLETDRIPMVAPGATFVGQRFDAEDGSWKATAVSMGNPHLVLFRGSTDDLDAIAIERVGPAIEHRPEFPNGVNVEFVDVLDASTIRMRVWERGVGETDACGTGACAAVVAAATAGLTNRAADVHLPGGTLAVDWRQDGRVLMTGPATWVFDGELADPWVDAARGGATVGASR
jgi:diaminopimelate epimerase